MPDPLLRANILLLLVGVLAFHPTQGEASVVSRSTGSSRDTHELDTIPQQNKLLCDGLSDDTDALNSLVARISSVGHGNIVLPQGTCIIRSVALANNIAFIGQGRGNTILKLRDKRGDYEAIFGTNRSRFTRVSFSHLTIDQNTRANPITSCGLVSGPRFVIATGSGSSSLRVDDVQFKGLANVNTIYAGSAFTLLQNDDFELDCSGSTYYDHSTVYVAGDHSQTQHNVFKGCMDRGGSVTAIEIHGSDQQVTDNTIDDYWIGMNITGVALAVSKQLLVADNIIRACYYGIQLWSNKYQSHMAGFGLQDVIVERNSIRITQTAWTKNAVTGGANLGNPSGIWVNPTANLPLANLVIQSNTVEYDLESDPSVPFNGNGVGIGYWDSTDLNTITSLHVLENTIKNASSNAISVSANGGGIEISRNIIINPGSSASSGLSGAYRNGVRVGSSAPMTGVRINDNFISDNLATSRIARAIYFDTPAGSELSAIGNRFSVSGTNIKSLQQFVECSNDTQMPLVKALVLSPPIMVVFLPSHKVAPGSTFIYSDHAFVYQADRDRKTLTWVRTSL